MDKKRIVGFDNHEHKKPHYHIKGKEYEYEFESVDKLIEDFYKKVERFIK